MTKHVDQVLKCLLVIWDSSAENSVFRFVPHISMELFGILMSRFLSSLHTLENSTPSDMGFVKIFFLFCKWPFCIICSVLCLTEVSHLCIVTLSVCATDVILRKWSPMSMSSRLLPIFSSIRFNVPGFMFQSLIHLDLSFMQRNKYGSIWDLLAVFYVTFQLSTPFVNLAFFSHCTNLSFFFSNSGVHTCMD